MCRRVYAYRYVRVKVLVTRKQPTSAFTSPSRSAAECSRRLGWQHRLGHPVERLEYIITPFSVVYFSI